MPNSTAQHVITTTTKNGKATYYEPTWTPQVNPGPFGTSIHLYSNPHMLPDVSANATADLDLTAEHSQTGIATMKGRIVPNGGLSTAILTINPGISVPIHRTRTVDTGVILEGEVELHLQNGEVRTLKPGDTFVMRGTMHKWVNVTDKVIKFFAVAVDAKPIMDGNGNELRETGW